MGCLGIIGTMKTTPKAALEALSGLPDLATLIKKKTMVVYFREGRGRSSTRIARFLHRWIAYARHIWVPEPVGFLFQELRKSRSCH